MKPFNPSTLQPINPSMRTEPRGGSVLMEAVLCLPLLLALATGIAQFARIWEARFFTWLAAYNAARATLVYNPRDYAETVSTNGVSRRRFFEDRGVAWLAAVDTLAWMSETEDSGSMLFPTMGHVPNSSRIREQVRIVAEPPTGRESDLRFSAEGRDHVRVCVSFEFPVFFSLFDPAILSRGGGNTNAPVPAVFSGVEAENSVARREGRLGRTFALRETVVLPKPWSTDFYPLLSRAERLHLLESASPSAAVGWWDNGSERLEGNLLSD